MNTLTTILAIWLPASVITGFVLGPILARSTPSPCERDAQDGRGEGGEGAIRTIHRSASK